MAPPEDAPDNNEEAPPENPEKQRTKDLVRRAGYVVFIGGGFTMFVMMMVGVVDGLQRNRAWNPYTGLPYQKGQCLRQARELMLDAGKLERLTPPWVGRYREWVARCKDEHGELYELLNETHSRLQKLPDEES